LPDQCRQIAPQACTEPVALLIGHIGGPALSGHKDRIDRVAFIHVEVGILVSGEEQAAQQQAAQPGISHILR